MRNTGNFSLTTRGDREIVMTRVFDAPRKLVFDAFTKPELVRQWLLGPPGWSMPVCEIDLRVGGAYRYVWRHTTKGNEMGMGGVYREIVPNARLVFSWAWHTTPERESQVTVSLLPEGGGTLLTLHHEQFFDEAARDSHARGWTALLEKLEKYSA